MSDGVLTDVLGPTQNNTRILFPTQRSDMGLGELKNVNTDRFRVKIQKQTTNQPVAVHVLREILSGSGATKSSRCTRKRVTKSPFGNSFPICPWHVRIEILANS